jgi:transcriptional regulator with PAS, ATPase and Fis domain
MRKILIGWLAVNNDFIKAHPDKGIQAGVNTEGPNYQFHKHFFSGYSKHLMLYSGDKHAVKANLLRTQLSKDFPDHQVEIREISISNVIDLEEIKPKVETILLELLDKEVDIFFSPGTSIMQVSWYICHTTLPMKTRLIQTVRAADRKSDKPVLEEIKVERSMVPYSSVIRQRSLDSKGEVMEEEGYKITDTLKPIYERAMLIAKADQVACLITGPTGTGKEHLAQYIRDHSPRKDRSFEKVNCAALGDDLLESRLFGHREGSFTGANSDQEGIFKKANKGTVFLDEVGDISPRLQQSLLRLLQEGEIQPIGGEVEKVDVRILAATNRDLAKMCEDGEYRWDLYYRLAVTELSMPALQERGPEEVDEMFEFFLDEKQRKFKRIEKIKPDKEVIQFVKSYPWPGNVRELEHFVENLYVFSEKKVSMNDIPERFKKEPETASLKIREVEAAHIRKVLKITKGNQRQAAKAIGWVENTLKSKMKKYGINPNEYQIK